MNQNGPPDDLAGRSFLKAQLRLATQLPAQRSPVMIPLQRPAPALPASLPLPLALEAPRVMVTETMPLRLTPPVTRPPPADETLVP
jgi:hypothetical protein